MGKTKLNVLLAKTDHLSSVFKKNLDDYIGFFKKNQGAFKGERGTYVPKEGTIDEPKLRGNRMVVTTVDEKLDYFTENNKDYIDSLFSQEKTNASGGTSVPLEVDGLLFGDFTSLELLRLKSILESGSLREMYENIPVRNDDEEWTRTKNEMYRDRNIYESARIEGTKKTTQKESYILPDPNIGKSDKANYTPQISTKDTVMELGDYSWQKFSGELSHVERASILQRRSKLLTAVIEALKTANETEIIDSDMTSEKLFGYLHKGKI